MKTLVYPIIESRTAFWNRTAPVLDILVTSECKYAAGTRKIEFNAKQFNIKKNDRSLIVCKAIKKLRPEIINHMSVDWKCNVTNEYIICGLDYIKA